MQLKPTHYIIAVIAVALVWWLYPESGNGAATQGYQTKALTTGKIESLVNSAGTLSPVITVEVGSEISGLVSELDADFNSEVTQGQVIARIDDRTIRARLKQNQADLASASASLEQQKANLAKAQADLKLNKAEYERQKDLRDKGLTSQSDLDRAEATYLNSEAQIGLAQAQVEAAKATILQREAQLEQAQLDLDRTYIRSPVNGTIINRQVDVGQTVAASFSAPVLFEIAADLTKMQIEADVDEADIGQIREGLSVRFSVDAFPDRDFDGEVTQVRKASTVTNNVVTYKVIISADNPRQQLLPGMTANVDVILGEKDDVLRIDNSALRFSPPDTQQGGPDGPGFDGMPEEIKAAMNKMDLASEQRDAVETAFEDMAKNMEAMREQMQAGGGFGPPGNNPMQMMMQVRTRLTNQLSETLNEEQVTQITEAMGGFGPPGGSNGRGRPSSDMRPGQLWVLEDGEPVPKRVMVGLSDDQYTEIVSDELTEGDQVIIRLARAN